MTDMRRSVPRADDRTPRAPSGRRRPHGASGGLAALLAVTFLAAGVPAGASAQVSSPTPIPPGTTTADGGTVLAELERPTPVSVYRDWLLFSRWDGDGYRLAVREPGGAIRDLDVPRQSTPFDADAGPDSKGRPSGVFSRRSGGDYDLYVIGFDEGDEPRPVRNANTKGHDEVAPSIAYGRLAFGRRYSNDRVVLYTKRLRWPRSRPSENLGSIPRSRNVLIASNGPRERKVIRDVQLTSTDIQGQWIAQRWDYNQGGTPFDPTDEPARWTPAADGTYDHEIRLTSISGRSVHQLAKTRSGEGGQRLVGPSVSGGTVRWAKTCLGDPTGCSRGAGILTAPTSSPDRARIERRSGLTWLWAASAGADVYAATQQTGLPCRLAGPDHPGGDVGEACTITRWRLSSKTSPAS